MLTASLFTYVNYWKFHFVQDACRDKLFDIVSFLHENQRRKVCLPLHCILFLASLSMYTLLLVTVGCCHPHRDRCRCQCTTRPVLEIPFSNLYLETTDEGNILIDHLYLHLDHLFKIQKIDDTHKSKCSKRIYNRE